MEKHPYFKEATFDVAYTQVSRSRKLSWNEKALINHVITWQERRDKDGKPLNLVCFETAASLAYALGIPETTMQDMIPKMAKKYVFFQSTVVKTYNDNGKIAKRTEKIVYVDKLAAFLNREEAERKDEMERQQGTKSKKKDATSSKVIEAEEQAPEEPQIPPGKVEEVTFQKQASDDDIFAGFDWSMVPSVDRNNPPPAPVINAEGVLTYPDEVNAEEDTQEEPGLSSEDMAIVDVIFNAVVAMTNLSTNMARKNSILDSLKHRARKEGFINSDRYDRLKDYVESYEMTSRIVKACKR